MGLLNNYNDYILDKLMESIKNDEIVLVISPELSSYLKDIDHPIAKHLLYYENHNTNHFISYL